MSSRKKQSKRLAWKVGRDPMYGILWGAMSGDMFLMIVYRQKDGANAGYYEVWSKGVIHNDAKHRTLAEAKAFAERLAHAPARKAA